MDHYQLRRVIDVFVAPRGEAIGGVANQMDRIIADVHPPEGVRVTMRGTVQAMRASFQSFGLGLILAVVLVYLILVAQFRSFIDPFLILLAVPPGITGVLLILSLSGTTLNIMSLMGVVMMVGIVTSNSILIVEFTHRLIEDGMSVREAVSHAVRVRLRPGVDDESGHAHRPGADGAQARRGQRILRAAGTRDYRRPGGVRGADGFHRSRGLPAGPRPTRQTPRGSREPAPATRTGTGRRHLMKRPNFHRMFRPAIRALVLVAFAARLHADLPAEKHPRHPAKTAQTPAADDFEPTVRPAAGTIQPVPPPARAETLPPVLRKLTLRQAENYALANQPRLAASQLNSQADLQRVYEARSAFFPQVQANAVGVKAKDDNNRLAAVAGITNPTILSRQSDGLLTSQLITDFGRTYYLTTSARSKALSSAQRTEVEREILLLRVDQAFFAVQGAQSLLEVANQTVDTNTLLLDRTRALAVSALKSSLDVSFAEVAAAQSQLLQIQAQARVQEGYAELSAALGLGRKVDFALVPQTIEPEPPAEVSPLIATALAHRPDLLAARADLDAAKRFAKAERAARFPTITGQAGYGVSPAHEEGALPPNYGAVGVNLNISVFTGGLLSARDREAVLRAQAVQKLLEDQETQASRDVYDAWFEARTAYQAIAVTQQLLASSQQAFQLAQGRYNAGTSSIVELSQAELQQIQAQIASAMSRFDYQVRRRALDFQLGVLK